MLEVRNTMQPGDSQQYWRSNQTQLQNQQNPPQPTSGQSQEPSSQRNNVPPKGFRNWFRTKSPRTKLGFGLIIIALLLCMFAVYEYGSSIGVPKSNPTVTNAENTKTELSPGATSGST